MLHGIIKQSTLNELEFSRQACAYVPYSDSMIETDCMLPVYGNTTFHVQKLHNFKGI